MLYENLSHCTDTFLYSRDSPTDKAVPQAWTNQWEAPSATTRCPSRETKTKRDSSVIGGSSSPPFPTAASGARQHGAHGGHRYQMPNYSCASFINECGMEVRRKLNDGNKKLWCNDIVDDDDDNNEGDGDVMTNTSRQIERFQRKLKIRYEKSEKKTWHELVFWQMCEQWISLTC